VRRVSAEDATPRKKAVPSFPPARGGLTPPAPLVGNREGPALTVRVEINLPVTEDQQVYDKIFRSIRANLLNEQALACV
jgi:hypothetical protein